MSDRDRQARTQWITDAVDAYERRLVSYAARITGDVNAARDVVQDVFCKLCETDRKRVDSHLAAWLYTATRHRAIDRKRKGQRMLRLTQQHVAPPRAPEPPDHRIERTEAHQRLMQRFDELPEEQREALRLKLEHGLTYRDIAQTMNKSVPTVGYLLHTALSTLREQLSADHVTPIRH